MNFFLLDTPVFVTRYTLGRGYPFADQLLAQAVQGRLCCSILSLAEVVATLVSMRRRGLLSPVLFAGARLQFRLEVIQSTSVTKLSLDRSQVETFLTLIDQHHLDSYAGLVVQVGLDHAVQLRAAGHDLVLVSSGKRFLKVARLEGLLTFNPEVQTQTELDALLGP